MNKILLYDTTMRDGAQTVGISFSLQDKLRIAAELDRLKVDYIEGGWPGSNPKDDLFFKEVGNCNLQHAKVAAFGSTKRPKISCKDDALLNILADSGAKTVTVVAKTWDFHVTKALNIDLKENLTMIYETVS
ncbi:MAG TPA: citramalate synthase, partial [Spirochaetota bacterium]|nr:citramalate synthase [Spirochaetota bacterium]